MRGISDKTAPVLTTTGHCLTDMFLREAGVPSFQGVQAPKPANHSLLLHMHLRPSRPKCTHTSSAGAGLEIKGRKGTYSAAMVASLFEAHCDWASGVARRMQYRYVHV